MSEQKKAYFAAIVYAIIIGFSFIFTKISLIEASPLDTLAHRFTMAFLIAIILKLLYRRTSVKMRAKDTLKILPLVFLYPILFFTFQVFGLVYTSSLEAGIIQATIPIFTLLSASLFLKEYAGKGQKFFLYLSVMGVIFIFVMNDLQLEAHSLKGTILILFSSIAAAFYNVVARTLTKQYSLFTLTYVMTFFGFVTFNSMAIINHIINQSISSFFLPLTSSSFLISIVYLGALSSLLTGFLSNYALSILPASKMSVFSNLATLITIIAGVIFLHESIHYYHVVGAMIILVGVIGTNYFGSNRSKHISKTIADPLMKKGSKVNE
ncbi:DMT family transporter [Peribacillus butanolivorans]|uniref:DMT family transporter n=1 Tax=Peribacillus butanolivorans TaxID=421767 RepID=UPI002E1F3701|nr:DMT family transporter [Peribacillus butanolivorans]